MIHHKIVNSHIILQYNRSLEVHLSQKKFNYKTSVLDYFPRLTQKATDLLKFTQKCECHFVSCTTKHQKDLQYQSKIKDHDVKHVPFVVLFEFRVLRGPVM